MFGLKKISSGEIQENEMCELGFDVEENLIKKIPSFLKAKFLGKKYEASIICGMPVRVIRENIEWKI